MHEASTAVKWMNDLLWEIFQIPWALSQKRDLLEAEGSFFWPPAGCAWKACPARPVGRVGCAPHPTPGELLCPSVLLEVFLEAGAEGVQDAFAVAADTVSHLQLSKDGTSWRISLVSFTLSNPTERQHIPNCRLVFSEFTSLMRDMRLSGCGLECRAQELTPNPQNENFRREDLRVHISAPPPHHQMISYRTVWELTVQTLSK